MLAHKVAQYYRLRTATITCPDVTRVAGTSQQVIATWIESTGNADQEGRGAPAQNVSATAPVPKTPNAHTPLEPTQTHGVTT